MKGKPFSPIPGYAITEEYNALFQSFKEAFSLLKSIVLVLEYQDKDSIANQGQCLDGYSALHNYNELAKKIKQWLETWR